MALQPIFANCKDLLHGRYSSNLKADYNAGSSTITINSISQFAVDQVLLIGEWGSEGSEIIKTHASTAPTGNTVTLASNLVKAHAKDTTVYIIPYDQIEFSHADTLTGTKTVLATLTIDPEEEAMLYDDTGHSAGYYFTRYKNSIDSSFDGYSDGVPYDGLPADTVGYAIDTAMNELGEKFTDVVTFGLLLGYSRQMLRLVRGKLNMWSKYKEVEYNLGTLTQGVRKYAVPDDLYEKTSNRSIANLRIGTDTPLTPIDQSEYLQATDGVAYTEVQTQAEIGATSLVLDDTSDLDDTGSISVYVSGTSYDIEYTVNNRTTNTLTVATDQITATLTVDSQVWQGMEEGTPLYYSVQEEYVLIYPIPTSSYAGRNITVDYYTDIEDIDSQMDVLKGSKFDMLIPYLKWKIKAITRNNGEEDMKDVCYAEFRELLNDAVKNEQMDESIAFRPRPYAIYGGRASNSKR